MQYTINDLQLRDQGQFSQVLDKACVNLYKLAHIIKHTYERNR